MGLCLLLDQNTERELASRLRDAGHDVERVVEVPDLGEGASDDAICDYARRQDRIVVTYDSDFATFEPDSHAGIFLIPDQTRTTHEVFSIIQAVQGYYDNQDAMAPVVFLTPDWL